MATTVTEAPRLDLNFVDADVIRDPYPTYRRVRELGPVVYNDLLPIYGHTSPGGYMVTSFKACQHVLGNARKFGIREDIFRLLFGDVTFAAIDTPSHDEKRAVWQGAFSRESLRTKRTEMITEVVADRLEPFFEQVESGQTVDAADLVDIPIRVIAHMMGVPASDCPQFVSWGEKLVRIPEAYQQTDDAADLKESATEVAELTNAYIGELVRERSDEVGDDLVSMMAASEVARTMSLGEIVATNSQLLLAGTQTTVVLIGHCLVMLARHPDQRRALQEDRSLIPQAIEEIHRCETIAQINLPRFVADGDAEIAGVRVPEGAAVAPMFGMANRDPSRWDRPDEFDIFREQKAHLGFGFGMHTCLGLNLSRLETEIFLNHMFDRLPEWEVVGEPNYGTSFILRRAAPIWIGKG